MQRSGTAYTLGFAAAVCVVCSILVSGSAVLLKDRQDANVLFDRQKQVLGVCELLDSDEKISLSEAQQRFDDNIKVRIVDLATGEYADDAVALPFDPVRATKNPELSVKAPANLAQVTRLPKYGVVHEVMKNGQVDMVVLQVWGRGLWSTMYGYLALDSDCNTIRGLTFYDQAETPGLGGEVANPKWKALWIGRKAFKDGKPAIELIKGRAGSPADDPHRVDALSGATITSRAVQYLLNFWLSDEAYGPFLDKFRTQQPTTIAQNR